MVILRRKSNVSSQVNFNRTWTEYENGFGDLNTEFWYGLRNIHCLTTRDTVQLQVQLKARNGSRVTWTYEHFRVHGTENDYRLHIGNKVQGPSGGRDALRYHNGKPFTTFDNDNDDDGRNCATIYGGGWWFNSCYHSFLTGNHTASSKNERIQWYDGTGINYLPHVEMKIRRKSCPSPKPEKDC